MTPMHHRSIDHAACLTAVLFSLLALSCASRPTTVPTTGHEGGGARAGESEPIEAGGREIIYVADSAHTLFRSPQSALGAPSGYVDAVRIVVRDSSTWRAVWARLISPDARRAPPIAAPPAIDFARDMVIVAAQGPGNCSSGITIDTVYRVAHSTTGVAVVHTRVASSGCGCLAIARSPAIAIRVSAERLESIRFAERTPLDSCHLPP